MILFFSSCCSYFSFYWIIAWCLFLFYDFFYLLLLLFFYVWMFGIELIFKQWGRNNRTGENPLSADQTRDMRPDRITAEALWNRWFLLIFYIYFLWLSNWETVSQLCFKPSIFFCIHAKILISDWLSSVVFHSCNSKQ